MDIPLSAFAPENLVSRDRFGSPVPRQPAHLHTQAESSAYLRHSSRVPRWRLRPNERLCIKRSSLVRPSSRVVQVFEGDGAFEGRAVRHGCCKALRELWKETRAMASRQRTTESSPLWSRLKISSLDQSLSTLPFGHRFTSQEARKGSPKPFACQGEIRPRTQTSYIIIIFSSGASLATPRTRCLKTPPSCTR